MIALVLALAPAWAGTFDAADAATSPEAVVSALFAVIDDEALASDHAVAWARLGDALDAAELDGAAAIAWGRAFAADPSATVDRAVRAVEVAERYGDPSVVAGPLAGAESIQGEVEARSEVAYVVGRHELRADNLSSALTWLGRVDGQSKRFADAEAVRGIVLANQGRHDDALVPLQNARALASAQNRGERVDAKLVLNVARAFYAKKNWGQAIFHYTQVPRSSEYWPEANFERAWAHFRGQDMQGTLGLLHTPASPYFDGFWVPEAHMLRAQALFLMCKFTSAIDEIDAFEALYTPIGEQFDTGLAGMDAPGAWADVGTYLDGGSPKLPEVVWRRYRAEDRLAEARRAVRSYGDEAGRTGSLGAASDRVARLVTERRDALVASEGQRLLDGAKARRAELTELATGVELARIDILQLSSRMYERAAATGTDVEHGDRIGKLRDLRKRQRDHHVWPFEGEYWVDELGWYQVDARSDCPESMARKVE